MLALAPVVNLMMYFKQTVFLRFQVDGSGLVASFGYNPIGDLFRVCLCRVFALEDLFVVLCGAHGA